MFLDVPAVGALLHHGAVDRPAVRAAGVPAGLLRNEEGVLIGVLELGLDLRLRHPALAQGVLQGFAVLVEPVRQPLQEQHAEDVFLVLRGVHVAAKVVAGTEQETGELAEGELLGHGSDACLQLRD